MATAGVEARRHGLPLALAIGKAGVAAGVLGGLGMAAFMMTYCAFTGAGLLTPLKLFGATFYRGSALGPGFGAAFWGLVLHLAVSAALGVLFSAMFRADTAPLFEVAAAIVYALFAWLILTFLVLPVVDPVMRRAVPSMSAAWFGSHVVYGSVLGATKQLKRLL
jgi:hypothetical protein